MSDIKLNFYLFFSMNSYLIKRRLFSNSLSIFRFKQEMSKNDKISILGK